MGPITIAATYDADLERAAEMLDERLGAIDPEDYDADQIRTTRDDALNNAWVEGMTLDDWVSAAARLLAR